MGEGCEKITLYKGEDAAVVFLKRSPPHCVLWCVHESLQRLGSPSVSCLDFEDLEAPPSFRPYSLKCK